LLDAHNDVGPMVFSRNADCLHSKPTGSAMSAIDAVEAVLKVVGFITKEFAKASSLDSHCKEIGERWVAIGSA
jgi:hypothetical protein